MTTAGPNYAGTGADDNSTGTVTWSTPTNGTASDNSYATASMSGSSISHYLKLTNFGFSIPSGATINGITVEIERKSSSNASSISIVDVHVYIVKGGTIQTTQNKADTSTLWPTTDTFATYGGAADLWGVTWTDTDINASNFGVVINCKPSGLASRLASIDSARITIDYTAGSTNWALTATVSATSSISGSVGLARPLTGTITGASAVAGTITRDQPISGTITGASAISGSVDLARPLSGTISAVSDIAGTILKTYGISADITALSDIAGTLSENYAGVGTVTNASSITATMGINRGLIGTVAGASGVSGTLTVTKAAGTLAPGMLGDNNLCDLPP